MSLLTVRDLRFCRPEGFYLGPLSLEVQAGEILGLFGPNGSGKTTLIRLLGGELAPAGGEIQLAGSELSRLSRREIARRLARVPQEQHSLHPYTVREMIRFGRHPWLGMLGRPGEADRRAEESAVRECGLDACLDRSWDRLSGGEKRRVLIARALAQETALLVLDEPVQQLDLAHRYRVLALLRRIADRGRGIVVSLHDPADHLLLSDRILVLQDGRLLAAGRPDKALTPEILQTLYGMDFRRSECGGHPAFYPAKDWQRMVKEEFS